MSMKRLIGRLEEANDSGVTIRVLKDVIGKDRDGDRNVYKKFLSNYPADLQKKLLDLFDKKKEVKAEIARLEKELRDETYALGTESSKHGRWFEMKNKKDIEWKTADEIEQARNSR